MQRFKSLYGRLSRLWHAGRHRQITPRLVIPPWSQQDPHYRDYVWAETIQRMAHRRALQTV